MKVIEVLKVFGYIFVLLICFVLLQALSALEFESRDKSVSYEKIWSENFSNDLDTDAWTLIGNNIKQEKDQLILNLGPADNGQHAVTLFPTMVDSGYVSIKVLLPEEAHLSKTIVELIHNGAITIPLEKVDQPDKSYQELRSPIINGPEIVGISIKLDPAFNRSEAPEHEPETLAVKELQFMKLIRPKKLF